MTMVRGKIQDGAERIVAQGHQRQTATEVNRQIAEQHRSDAEDGQQPMRAHHSSNHFNRPTLVEH